MVRTNRNCNEEARLDALLQLRLLDTPASESFDRICRMASQIFELPVAAMPLTDHDRHWFKSRVGIEHQSIPREKAPCGQVAETTEPLIIEDFLQDQFYKDSLLARGGTRFYAGAPLVTREGYCLGSLCVLGTEPRKATKAELASLADLASIVMAQIELQHAFGRLDPVSGLPNRNQLLDDLLDLDCDQGRSHRNLVVVDFASESELRKIMRALGTARVDDLIREASASLRALLESGQAAYHIGQGQFAFLSAEDTHAAVFMHQLGALHNQLRSASAVRFVTSVAIGARPFTVGVTAPDEILHGAINAAQDARSSEGAVAFHSARRDTEHQRQYALMRDFGRALESEHQLRLVYQPRIDLKTNECIGAEALLRWQHAELGEISPGEFIPIIEQTSFVRATTQFVLNTALDQVAVWKRSGFELPVSINISAANLGEPDLVQRIVRALELRRLKPHLLELEITESAMMEDPDRALSTLGQLQAAGVCLAIDDFGTGHSSFAYLQRLPARVVKIDQTFIRSLITAAGSDFLLVEAIVNMAQKLGFRVVAEGIETAEAAAILRQLNCEEAQGFFFSRPLEADAIFRWHTEAHSDSISRPASVA